MLKLKLFFVGFVPGFIFTAVYLISFYGRKPTITHSDIIIFDPIEISEDIYFAPDHPMANAAAGRFMWINKATD